MSDFNKATATADELWDHCIMEYENPNPIVKYLFDNLFARIREIVSLLGENDRLLEVGCGAGVSSLRILDMLSGQEFQVSDVDERYVNKLKEIDFPLPVMQESVFELNRQDREYDCIFLLEVLEHIEQYERALAELFRVSRKYVVTSVPNEPLWRILNMARGRYLKHWGNTPGHINHWSPAGLRKLVSKYGTVLRVCTPPPWIIVLAQAKSN